LGKWPASPASWQERRAKEVIEANLDGEAPLAELARECGLSASHFSRAFRQTTGTSPHRWLLHRRVENAKRLLLERQSSLSEVALTCGFVDQSHFTRVFTKFSGAGPGAWRRGSLSQAAAMASRHAPIAAAQKCEAFGRKRSAVVLDGGVS